MTRCANIPKDRNIFLQTDVYMYYKYFPWWGKHTVLSDLVSLSQQQKTTHFISQILETRKASIISVSYCPAIILR
jgi:hypothetical protein